MPIVSERCFNMFSNETHVFIEANWARNVISISTLIISSLFNDEHFVTLRVYLVDLVSIVR